MSNALSPLRGAFRRRRPSSSGDVRPSETRIAHRDITQSLIRAALILLLSTLWTMIVPGIVAARGKVYYRAGLLEKLAKKETHAAKKHTAAKESKPVNKQTTAEESQPEEESPATIVKEHDASMKADRESLKKIDARLRESVEAGRVHEIAALLQYRRELSARIAPDQPRASVLAFHLNPQLFMWPAIYSCLGWLIVIFKPMHGCPLRVLKSRRFVVLAVLIYVIYEWPLYVRNFVLRPEGRKVWAYPNADIHFGSFVMQELVVIGFCVLVVWFWLQWAEYARYFIARPPAEDTAAYAGLIEDISSMFTEWQLRSFILTLGFVFFTSFFWTLVEGHGDVRYMLPAIQLHIIWATSWGLLSIPLLVRWSQWATLRRKKIFQLAEEASPSDQSSPKIAALQSIQPIGGLGISVSTIAALGSLLAPIVQLFIK